MSKPCILFSANPKAKVIKDNSGLSSALGSIYAHVDFLKKRGAVFWDIASKGTRKNPVLNQIKTGYIYYVPEKSIKYKVDIEYIKSSEEMDKEYQVSWEKYFPKFRFVYFGFPGLYWMKITNISRLTRNYTAKDFRKYKDGKPFGRKYIVGYDIAIDPEYPSEPYQIKLKEEIDKIISRCIDDGKYTEKDIENILEKTLLRKNFEFIHRQQPTSDGRIDIVFKDEKDVFYVIEIKKDADETALTQLKSYMRKIRDKYNPDDMRGIILCRNSVSSLTEAVKKESAIQIKKFRFSIEFDDL